MNSILKAAAVAASLTAVSTTAQANEAVAIMTEFYEVADARPFDFDALSAFFADDFTDHHPSPAMPADAPSGLVYQLLADGAPDSHHKIEMILPSGDDIAIIVWSYEGTNTDGLLGVPAKDPANPFAIAGIEVWKTENGKVSDLWHVEDIAGLMAQLTAE